MQKEEIISEAQRRIQDLEQALAQEQEARKNAADELRHTSDLLKATLNQLPVVICGIDNDGGIIFLNQEFEKVTGYSADELMRRHDVTDYLFPDRARKINPGANPSEWMVRSSDNQERIISWSGIQKCPIPGWEKWKVGLDITQLKQLERLRDDVESIVRHDLKSPLGAIIGLSSWLLDDTRLEDHQIKALRNIERSGDLMLRMLENSLALYKIEAGQFVYKPEPVNLAELLRDALENLYGLSQSHGVSWCCTVDGADLNSYTEFIVPGVESLLDNLFTNLLKNAVEASPDNEKVTIRITHTDTEVMVIIHNAGAIPEPIRDTFFDRFVTYGKSQGTGLGTYSAKRITLAHNGQLSFRTSDERGTDLIVILPLFEVT
ncbi:MAG: PAS domain-containing sensor histidine kinase [Kiritimatiellae bacterium]|nr:PAS domain-containing sensor histidine kinase [Kiritimatiellia bacterium]MDD4736119.1 PAS domain-containing sensor histidine kinase [Kiritimatiellia bacterium]